MSDCPESITGHHNRPGENCCAWCGIRLIWINGVAYWPEEIGLQRRNRKRLKAKGKKVIDPE